MRASRRFLPLLAAALLAGCGDDGVSVIEQDRGLTGLWIAWAPPIDDTMEGDMMPAPADTLLLRADGTGTWSREVPGSMGILPLRTAESVRYEQQGLGVYLSPLIPPCASCRDEAERMAALLPSALYRVRRPDEDHLVLEPVAGDASTVRLHYVRLPLASIPF